MAHARLAHGVVFVVDLQRAIRFYEGVFELVCRGSSDPGFVRLDPATGSPVGAAGVALHALPEAIARTITISTPPKWRDDTAYKLTFATDDLDTHRERILAHGGQAREPWSWEGRRYCECTDPEGNVVQLMEG